MTPKSWAQVPLGEVANLYQGFGFPKKLQGRDAGELGFYKVSDISRAVVAGNEHLGPAVHCISRAEAKALRATPLPKDSVVFARIGEAINLNRRALLPADALVDNNVIGTKARTGIEDRYLFYFLKTVKLGELSQATTVPAVRTSDIAAIKVPVAPTGEQKRIVSKLDELFSDIEEGERALERVQKLVERYRQSVLKAAVTGELTREWRQKHKGPLESGEALLQRILEARREAWEKAELAKMKANGRKEGAGWKAKYIEPLPPDATELPQLPERWVWARAEQLCDFITKGTTPAASDMKVGAGEVPYIKVYNLTFDRSLDFDKDPTFIAAETHRVLLARSRVLPGDVVMNIVGPPLGKVSVVPESFPEWNMNQAVCVFRPYAGVENQFLASYLLSRAAQDWYAKKSKATVGQVNLTLEVCRDTPVPIPPQSEQREIVELLSLELSRIAALAHSLQRDRAEATALRQSVLSAAFSGELVAQDTTDEPASELLSRLEDLRAAEQELTRVRAGLSKTQPLAQVMKEHGIQPKAQRRNRAPRGV